MDFIDGYRLRLRRGVGDFAEEFGGNTRRSRSRPARRNTSPPAAAHPAPAASVQPFASAPLAWTRNSAGLLLAAVMPSITRLRIVVGEARPLPDVAIDIGVDDVLQRRAELAGRRHALVDIGLAEQLFAPAQAARVQFTGVQSGLPHGLAVG